MTTLLDWLERNHYRESTRRDTVRGLHAAQEAFTEGRRLPQSAVGAAGRILAFSRDREAKDPSVNGLFLDWLRGQDVAEVRKLPRAKPRARVRQAVSLDQDRWFKLHDVLEKSSVREDLVLFVVLRSGLRIGDVLRTPVSKIERGLKSGVLEIERKGGYQKLIPVGDNADAWIALAGAARKRGALTVAEFLCPENASPLPGDCAYQRANRRLKFYQEKLRCVDSLHLHRLRRTLAVAALRETKGDLIKVQQMLGHEVIASTQRYTDELQVEGIAALQSQLFNRKR